MSLRSKLLATVALPVFSAALWTQPTAAEEITSPMILAQEDAAPANAEPLPPQQQPVQSDADEIQREADEQMKAAEEERKRQERELQEEAQKAREQVQAEEKAAAEEAARQAEQQQLEAEQNAKRDAQELEKAAQEAREKAIQEQQAAEEEAARQAEAQREATKKEAERQAQELEAKRQAEEQKKATEQESQRQLEEQKAIEDQAKKEAERSQREIEESKEPKEVPASPADQAQPEAVKPDAPEQPTPPSDATSQPQKPAPALEGEPAEEQQPKDQTQPEQEEKPSPTEAPAETNEEVLLPVDNGAAILDSNKDADNAGDAQSRAERRKEHIEQSGAEDNSVLPTDDAAAQSSVTEEIPEDLPSAIEANLKEKGKRIEEAPTFAVPETTNIINNTVVNNTTVNNIDNQRENIRVVERLDHRMVLDVGNRSVVRNDDRPRLRRNAQDSFYEELPQGRLRETIIRPGGYQIVTLYDRFGDVIQRSRIDRDGNEYLLLYAPQYEHNPRGTIIDVGYDLPPMRLSIPVSEYMIDVSDEPDAELYDFFARPPVERVERLYTLEEVRHSARLRDKMRRVDLDTIEFATGSAEVSLSQAKTLRKVADAIQKALEKDPGETFLVEGHTDAVGSDRSNLVLSDQRAESVAILLSDVYDVPAENLVTQGYGERYLKIKTQAAEQKNRRVTIRRITPLVRPVAQR